jgi:hypothetical protein
MQVHNYYITNLKYNMLMQMKQNLYITFIFNNILLNAFEIVKKVFNDYIILMANTIISCVKIISLSKALNHLRY